MSQRREDPDFREAEQRVNSQMRRERRQNMRNMDYVANEDIELRNSRDEAQLDDVAASHKKFCVNVRDFDENDPLLQEPLCDTYVGKIGDKICPHENCKAMLMPGETSSLCCNNGKVKLRPFPDPPEPLLSQINNPEASNFKKYLHYYNTECQMASIEMQRNKDIVPQGTFQPCISIHGQIVANVRTHLEPNQEPTEGMRPKPHLLQRFFYNPEHNEQRAVTLHLKNRHIDDELILSLQGMLADHHSMIKDIKMVNERFHEGVGNRAIVFYAKKGLRPPGAHPKNYALPEDKDFGMILNVDDKNLTRADTNAFVLYLRKPENGYAQTRISFLNGHYNCLAYPLLFPRGELGWSKDLQAEFNVTQAKFASYVLMYRQDLSNHIVNSWTVSKQFMLDLWARIELNNILWYKEHQKEIKAEMYLTLELLDDETQKEAGKKTILPQNAQGTPRWYKKIYLDGMAMVIRLGKPGIFLTMTCNPNWKEIKESLAAIGHPNDPSFCHPDIIDRVFERKKQLLHKLVLKGQVFGRVLGHFTTVEFQKRGLPHSHTLFFMSHSDLLDTAERIDSCISAEIPDPEKNPLLFELVKANMIHGPCGENYNTSSPCWDTDKKVCTKGYPKEFNHLTVVDDVNYTQMRRLPPGEGGHTVLIKIRGRAEPVEVDNRWVVEYNPFLLLIFECHINLQHVFSKKPVKYLCKYCCKGQDRALCTIRKKNCDECGHYADNRYVSDNEAAHKILGHRIHEHNPPVVTIPVHLEKHQLVVVNEGEQELNEAMAQMPPGGPVTKLMGYFARDEILDDVKYVDINEYCTWDEKNKKWNLRKQGKYDEQGRKVKTICSRLPHVSPRNKERFFLRSILILKPCRSYEDARTWEGVVHPTYEACAIAMGIIDSDLVADTVMVEAVNIMTFIEQIRNLFVTLLLYTTIRDPAEFLEKFLSDMSADFLRLENVTEEEAKNKALLHIQSKLAAEGKTMFEVGLPEPVGEIFRSGHGPLLDRELSYDVNELENDIRGVEQRGLNSQQEDVVKRVLESVHDERGGKVFLLNACGGAGKTYVINHILNKVRFEKKVALATATSGIAATLLNGGRTVHSTFKVPLDLKDNSTCSMTKICIVGLLMKKTDLIVIDEVTMGNKLMYEALDRSLRFVRDCDQPFGGITVLFSGDFRQILPVVPRGSRNAIVDATLKRSHLWDNVTELTLTINERVARTPGAEAEEIAEWASRLLQIGNGEIPRYRGYGGNKIRIPASLVEKDLESLIAFVFQDPQWENPLWVNARAIIAPKNKDVDKVNKWIMEKCLPTESRVYFAKNQKKEGETIDYEKGHNYPEEFLNDYNPNGFPKTKLVLKIGASIMLLRNLDPMEGHVNGARYSVIELRENLIIAQKATGTNAGILYHIPRIVFHTGPNEAFQFERRQFPVAPAFAVTTNKSQGQTYEKIGIYLENDCFTHGQLYVAASRVGKEANLKFYIEKGKIKEAPDSHFTNNVVYPEVLRNDDALEDNHVPLDMANDAEFAELIANIVEPNENEN